MANDALGQTIPTWVEDNSYELKSVITFDTANEGHLSPCSDVRFSIIMENTLRRFNSS